MFTVLRQRNFALLWFGQLISLIGDWVLFIALPFYIYELTGSTLATGAMFIAQLLPGLLLGSVAGVCADRWDRKRMMIAADVLRALVLLLLLVVRSTEWLWLIYLVAFAQSAIGQFFMPARSALIPQIVGEQELLQANSLSAVSDSLTRLIGPSLGGLLFAWFGLASVVFVDAASFAVSALLIALVVVPARHIGVTAAAQSAATWARVWRDWRDGLRVIRRERLLVGLFVVMGLFSVADAIFTTLLVGFAKDIMRIGTQQLGVMMALQGVGGLLGGLVLTRVGQRLAPARLIALACLVDGVILFAIFNLQNFVLALALIFVAGVFMVGAMVSVQTLLQLGARDEFRGRVFGAFMTSGALTRLIGIVIAGSLGDIVGIVPVLNLGALLWLATGAVAFALLPVTRHAAQPVALVEPAM